MKERPPHLRVIQEGKNPQEEQDSEAENPTEHDNHHESGEYFSDQELSAELAKDARFIDYDFLLSRAGNQPAMRRIYRVAEDELKRMASSEEKRLQSIKEYYATHSDDRDEVWWIVARFNELMDSPLRLHRLPDWDKAADD
jgi:hypothetical protein